MLALGTAVDNTMKNTVGFLGTKPVENINEEETTNGKAEAPVEVEQGVAHDEHEDCLIC